MIAQILWLQAKPNHHHPSTTMLFKKILYVSEMFAVCQKCCCNLWSNFISELLGFIQMQLCESDLWCHVLFGVSQTILGESLILSPLTLNI